MKKKFFILGPSRCRSAWLAAFFTTGTAHCWHEATRKALNAEHFEHLMEGPSGSEIVGNSDSGMCLNAEWFLEKFPDARFLLVHRALNEVRQSLHKHFKVSFNQKIWRAIATKYLQACRVLSGNGRLVNFAECSDENVMRDVWAYATWDSPWQPERWELFRDLVVQVPPSYDLTYQSGFQRDLLECSTMKELQCQVL